MQAIDTPIVDAPIFNNRYVPQATLGEGGMGTVFRAHDRLTGGVVAVKSLTIEPSVLDMLSSSGMDLRLALTHEFQVLATLRHPHIVSVLDYGFDDTGRPFFTMEFVGDAVTILEYAQGLDSDALVGLFWQAVQALRYLHRRGIVHRDLKPDNMLVLPDSTVKLLDFGLATVQGQYNTETMVGTLPYMPPEVLAGQPHTQASDLYTLALILYEVLNGGYPFPTAALDELSAAIQGEPLPVEHLPASDALKTVLARLLAKDPAERYPDVDSVITAYADLSGTPLPPESPHIRDSHLQAARFIGREHELSQLTEALKQLVEGVGSAWLVGGESGVGKTRLLNELRVLALVRGVKVLHTQATIEADALNRFWREPLRILLLDTELSDFEASVLSTILPDLAQFIGREIAPPPDIAPKAARDRLFTVMTSVFRRQQQPVLLLLEDLHWLNDSRAAIEQLTRLSSEHPLMLVGNFRDDERPDLPHALPGMHLLKLHRLAEDEMSALTVSILGEQSGRRADLLRFLQQQTEGNVFFIVETMRALAEEAGQLQTVGDIALPENLVTTGVRNVIQRRLERIAPEDLYLLRVAALMGRTLDMNVLALLSSPADLATWLERCAVVLEPQGTDWRFAHDKLREGVVAAIADDEQTRLHRQIARTLEQVYGDHPDHTIQQAFHWGAAGVAEREAHYSALAGTRLLQQGGYRTAMRLLERANTLGQQTARPGIWRAQVARHLADAAVAVGRPQESLRYLNEALTLLDAPHPPGDEAQTGTIDERIARAQAVDAHSIPAVERQLMIDIYIVLGYNYFEMSHDVGRGVDCVLLATALQEPFGLSVQLADCYALLATALQAMAVQEQAAHFAERAAAILVPLDEDRQPDLDGTVLARALSNLAFYWTFAARWDESIRDGERAAALYQRTGDLLRSRATLMNLAVSYEWRGDFVRGMELRRREYDTALRGGDLFGQLRALAGVGQLHAYLGNLEESLASFERRAELAIIINNPSSTRYTYLGMIAWRLGRRQQAREALARAIEEMRPTVIPTGHDMFSIQNTAEVLLGLWEAEPDHAAVYARDAPMVMNLVEQYSRRYLAGEAQMQIILGRYAWLQGNTHQAMKTWQHALDLATRRGCIYAKGLAHFEIGRHLPPGDPTRPQHLAQARFCFEQTGTQWDVQRLYRVLAAEEPLLNGAREAMNGDPRR